MDKTNTAKNSREKGRSAISHRKKFKRKLEIEDTRGHTVNKKSGKNNISQKRLRNFHGKQERASNFKEVAIFAFSNSNLLKSANTTSLINNAMLLKVYPESSSKIFITLKNFDSSIEEIRHHIMKNFEAQENLMFSAK
ncbi:hypothetical protein CsSME_00007776 [Camellia sinensis var. sinensis]